jgi:hypothetical protein
MIDLYIKYGMVIVAVVVIGILLAMSFRTGIPEIGADSLQAVTGDSNAALIKLNNLCARCAGDIDKECFLVQIRLTAGNLTNLSFHGKTKYLGSIINASEKAVVKIASNQSSCMVRRI